jgi:glycosyltransferase involved in cell wall biosynthesis
MTYGSKLDVFSNHGPQPMVTVVVVTHPGDWHLLPRALRSLKGQLPAGQLEVIIMRDGPYEISATEIEQLAQCCPHAALDFIATPEHSGYYTVARNRSMEFARGLYIAHMDADNEYAPGHLEGLLRACRIPDPTDGWPHFAYTRRLYVSDEGWVQTEEKPVPLGPSPLIEWNPQNCKRLLNGPQYNFIDTGDMLIPRSVLFMLADKTGYVWNSNARRYGDADLVTRLMGCSFRGRAIDQVTNIYHWTGANLQLTRGLSEVLAIPAEVYEKLKAEGKLK